MDSQQTLAERVEKVCHLRGEFLLRSEQVSDEYFDKYLFESDPVLVHDLVESMVGLLPPCDVLAGMEMGGIPLVAVMSQVTGLPAVFVRKAPKEYGTRKAVEGVDVAGRRVVAVEDVVTSAGALVSGCERLRNAGAEVSTAVCVIDREKGGGDALLAIGVRLHSVLSPRLLADAQGR